MQSDVQGGYVITWLCSWCCVEALQVSADRAAGLLEGRHGAAEAGLDSMEQRWADSAAIVPIVMSN